MNKQTRDAQKELRELALSQHFHDYYQHEPFTFIPATQHKHHGGNDKTNRQTTNNMKTKGKERGVGRAPTLLIVTNLHTFPLFVQQHEHNGDGKTNG